MITRGDESIGFFNSDIQPSALPPEPEADDVRETIDYLTERLTGLETLIEAKADSSRLKSQIAFSDEAIKIQSEEIVLVGTVTIADIVKEQNGTTSGQVDATITRIIGDRIQTGTIISNNWGASAGTSFDLDNGTVTIGGSDSPALQFDGTDLFVAGTIEAGSVIAGSVTVGSGDTLSTIESNAQSGFDIQQKLEVSGTTVLQGVIEPTDSGALKTGSITWDSSDGSLTGGTGVAMTEWGIIGANNGSATFSIEASTGNAVFAGELSAASGTFAGSLSAVDGTFAGTLSAVDGDFSGNLSATNTDAVFIDAANGIRTGTQIQSETRSDSIPGIFCEVVSPASADAVALQIQSGKISKPRVSGHHIRVWDASTGDLVNTFEYEFL